ncbi:MAG: tetratricopeptide repeat protein [Chitinophagaceae bacterium]|nr:tetratricopeptide repeat protein [Chitinophagaceae bacterium]
MKEYEQAITKLNRSLEYKKDFLNTYLELGFANTKLKRNEEAIAQFKKAMEIDPKAIFRITASLKCTATISRIATRPWNGIARPSG